MMAPVNGVNLSLACPLPLFSAEVTDRKVLPSRVKLLGWGRNETSSGPVIVDEQTARVFAANQRAIGRERVAVDFEHNTVPGTTEYNRTQEPRPVAGHSGLVCVAGEGIFAEAVTYTASGEASARNYEDVSLAPYLDKERRVIAAHSWTVTHTGAAYGLDFKEAAALSAHSQLSAELNILSSQRGLVNQQNKNMAEKFITLAALAGILNLDASSADEAAITTELKRRLAAPAPAPAALSASDINAAVKAALTPLTAQLTALENKLTISEAALIEGKRTELITLFATQGKVPLKKGGAAYTAEELKALPVDTLELLLANTAVTVPLSARNAAHATESGKKNYRVKVGDKEFVDLSSIFNDEAKRSGLTDTAPATLA